MPVGMPGKSRYGRATNWHPSFVASASSIRPLFVLQLSSSSPLQHVRCRDGRGGHDVGDAEVDVLEGVRKPGQRAAEPQVGIKPFNGSPAGWGRRRAKPNWSAPGSAGQPNRQPQAKERRATLPATGAKIVLARAPSVKYQYAVGMFSCPFVAPRLRIRAPLFTFVQ